MFSLWVTLYVLDGLSLIPVYVIVPSNNFSISYLKPKIQRKKDLKGCLIEAKRILRDTKTPSSSVRRVSENYLTEDFSEPIRDDKNVCWFIISENSHLDVCNKWFHRQQQLAHQFQESLTSVTCPSSDHDGHYEEDDPTLGSSSMGSRIPNSTGRENSIRLRDAWPEMVRQGRRKKKKKRSCSFGKSLKKSTSFTMNKVKSNILSLSSMMQVTSINKRDIVEMREQALLAKPFHGPQADGLHIVNTTCRDTNLCHNTVDSNSQSRIWYPTLLDHIQHGHEVFV